MAQPQGRARLASPADAAVTVLRRRGLRASASRRLILEILRDAPAPLSAPEIARGPGDGSTGLDLASVYRNLEILAEHELVQEIHPGRGPGRYVLAGVAAREYLACQSCGRIREVDPGELDGVRALIRKRYGFDVAFSNVPMVGRCGPCLADSGR